MSFKIAVISRCSVLVVVLVLCQFIKSSDSTPLLDSQGNEIMDTKSPEPTSPSNCFRNNGQTPMEGGIPDPYDCNRFYICTVGDKGYPEPVGMNCQNGHDKKPLFYDFRKCYCEARELSTCYNLTLPDHLADHFICAHPLGQEIDNSITI